MNSTVCEYEYGRYIELVHGVKLNPQKLGGTTHEPSFSPIPPIHILRIPMAQWHRSLVPAGTGTARRCRPEIRRRPQIQRSQKRPAADCLAVQQEQGG